MPGKFEILDELSEILDGDGPEVADGSIHELYLPALQLLIFQFGRDVFQSQVFEQRENFFLFGLQRLDSIKSIELHSISEPPDLQGFHVSDRPGLHTAYKIVQEWFNRIFL